MEVTQSKQCSDSRMENATDAATKEIHGYTEMVKIHPEVRKNYMFWEEYVELLKEELKDTVKEEGRQTGKAEDILELLEDYGEVPAKLQEKILNEKDMAVLKCWLKIAAKVNSVEEFEKESIIYSSH